MQLRYVATELGSGLKRNLSMTIAVVLTVFVSLTLVGAAFLMRSEVGLIERHLGSQLEVKIVFCGDNSLTANCVGGRATDEQEKAVEQTLSESEYVSNFRYETREEALASMEALHGEGNDTQSKILQQLNLGVDDMSTAYWATLAHPDDNVELLSQVQNLAGVEQVIDGRDQMSKVYDILDVLQWLAIGGALALVLAAVLQVANTIRLAAMARRREIGIMRLVGASSLYIQLPFLLEILFAALAGAALACGALLLAMRTGVKWLHDYATALPWVENSDAYSAMIKIVIIAVLLGTIPTLLMTRKYLKV